MVTYAVEALVEYLDRSEVDFGLIDGYWGDAGESIDAYYDVNDFVRSSRRSRAS
jgi:hypothetical protein